jgi:DNA replication protein DnaC
MRVPRLLELLAIARASVDYSGMLARFAKIDILILDDFLLAPMTDVERRDRARNGRSNAAEYALARRWS